MLVHILEGFDMNVTMRARYALNEAENSELTATDFSGVSLTRQDQKDEADINYLLKNFGVTGLMPRGIRVPTYGDFTGIDDYQTALDAIRSAEGEFMKLPAGLREQFRNDAGAFVDFCSDPANLEEMRNLGLAVPAAPEQKPE